jgi:hypothetical protein
MRRFLLATILLTFFSQLIFCQEWTGLMQQPGKNFYDIQRSFKEYWKDKDIDVKGQGYKQFKRWENFMEPRVYPSGDLTLPSRTWENYQTFLDENNQSGNKLTSSSMIASTTWTAMGPFGPMSGLADNGFPRKAGRDNFITFHPAITNTYWVGAPAGGLWKTTNNGASWTTTTDNLAVIGCSDLAIDPVTPNTMYLATGDGDAGDTYCIGVLKSTDGGATWNATGLVFPVSSGYVMRRLIIDPLNPLVLFAATNGGIYRTINGGTSWTQVSTLNAYDVEFKPGSSTTIYAAGTTFYISTNSGASFTQVSSGIPITGCNRMSIAVTPADPNYVYVIGSNSSTNGFLGLYRSINSAGTFSTMSTSPDVLANACNGTGAGAQGWYDLCIGASPLNKDLISVGGVNVWSSNTGGATGSWTCTGCWIGTAPPSSYIHADQHEVEYNSAGVMYSANDGGIYTYNGSIWTDLTSPRNIAQIYKIGLSTLSANMWITGHQDNGSNIYNGTTYNASHAGDGMDCFIDRTNNSNIYCAQPSGTFLKSTNGGGSWAAATTGQSGTAGWVAPWKQDPIAAATLYAGRSQMFVSTNSGTSWTQLTATGGSGTIVEFAISPVNNQLLFVIHGTSIFKTTNAGTSWSNITGTIPVGSGAPTFITVSPTNSLNAWVTLSGYSAGNKVFQTTNGGTTWTNISSNLPNLPANCSVYQAGTSDRIYVGMDVGVYYKDNLAANWTLYSTGLPNVVVSDMEISPATPTKLMAATYGRGVYVVDVVPVSAPPVSSFSNTSTNCSGVPITFTDLSANIPTSWSWSVTPAVGVTINTATSQNPIITFANAGTYSVLLQASNGFGAGNVSTQTVIVTATPTIAVTGSVQTICSGNTATITASGATTYSWNTGATTGAITPTLAVTTNYTVTGFNGTCSSSKTSTITVNPSPTVNATSASICVGSNTTITASGATTYSWNTGAITAAISVTPALTTVYTVTGTTGTCKTVTTTTVTVNSTPTVVVNSSTICSGSSANLSASGAATYSWNTGATTANINPSPAVTTVYTVTGTNGACSSNKTTTVVVSPSPSVNATSNNSVICVGQQVILNATGGLTYTWQPGSVTGATITDSPAASQVYTVSGSAANGCIGSNTVSVNVSLCTGIAQLNGSAVKYNVYPNPAKDQITLNVNVFKNLEITIELIDASGKIALKQTVKFDKTKNDQQINISSVASGVYFLKLISKEGNIQTIKLVKE